MARRIKPAGSTQEERDRISLGCIESYIDSKLAEHVKCPSCRKQFDIKDLSSGTARLLISRYDKLRPSLSATEVTHVDRRDTTDPAELQAKLRAMYDSNPELFAFLQANAPQQTPIEDPTKRLTH